MGRVWWTDGRPFGFSKWNDYYFQNLAPQSILHSQTETLAEMTREELVQDARNVLQPEYNNFTMCTVLIGTPGPEEMEFLVIPCAQRISVSGILCIDGGKKPSPRELVYNLVHLKLTYTKNVSGAIHYFNIEEAGKYLLNEQFLSSINFVEDLTQRAGNWHYYELLDDEVYRSLKAHTSERFRWTWKESIYGVTEDECDVFGSQQCPDGFLQRLSKQIMVLTDPSSDAAKESFRTQFRGPITQDCPNGYSKCGRECVSDLHLCDGEIDCLDAGDEAQCRDICGAEFNISLYFCLNDCHPANCSCSAIFYQCLDGGCLHNSKLCDGQDDCIGGDDEMLCVEPFKMSTSDERNHLVNDLFPDTIDATDEFLYISMLKRRHYFADMNSYCDSKGDIPCMLGHPHCYPIGKRCVYDHDGNGHLRFCRNGFHLHNCQKFECSGRFKCSYSYCVPFHKICDGTQDCPYGDDEADCPFTSCDGMLRCDKLCIHPQEICDGVNHCILGEDELLCDAPKCPSGCKCNGYAVICSYVPTFDSSAKGIIYLTVRSNTSQLEVDTFYNFERLLFLDLSLCNVNRVSGSGVFQPLSILKSLNLSHNNIESLTEAVFLGLGNLHKLDLSWNPLQHLTVSAFDHLHSVRFLYLHHTKLRRIPWASLGGAHYLAILDLSHSEISHLGSDCARSVTIGVLHLTGNTITDINLKRPCFTIQVITLISDQKNMCCLKVMRTKCSLAQAERETCRHILMYPAFKAYIVLVIILVVCINACVLLFHIQLQGKESIIIANLALCNITIVIPLCILLFLQSHYGDEFAFYKRSQYIVTLSGIAQTISLISTQQSVLCTFLIAVAKWKGVTQFTRHTRHSNLHAVLLVGWCILAAMYIAIFSRVKADLHGHLLLGEFVDTKIRILFSLWSITDITVGMATVVLYRNIEIEVKKSSIFAIGRKHGGQSSSYRGIPRLRLHALCMQIGICGPSLLVLYMSLVQSINYQTSISLFILLFPMASMINPFLFTITTPRFSSQIKNGLCRINSKSNYR